MVSEQQQRNSIEFNKLTYAQIQRVCRLGAVVSASDRLPAAALAYTSNIDVQTAFVIEKYLKLRHKRLIYASQLMVHNNESWFKAFVNASPFTEAQVNEALERYQNEFGRNQTRHIQQDVGTGESPDSQC